MNKTIINRIIGSIVLGLVAVAVLPKLLTPGPSDFSMQGFEVVVNSNGVDKIDNSPVVNIDNMPTLELQSITSDVNENVPIGTNAQSLQGQAQSAPSPTTPVPAQGAQTLPVKLESLTLADNSQAMASTPSTPSTTNRIEVVDKKSSWIRVGSYADLENAEKLAKQFKERKLPVKVEEVQISGVAYRRVLIGPFTDTEKLDQVLKVIQAEGHTPAVQYQ